MCAALALEALRGAGAVAAAALSLARSAAPTPFLASRRETWLLIQEWGIPREITSSTENGLSSQGIVSSCF
jgi:hypothetical protein